MTAPVILSIVPAAGSDEGGDSVVITGAGFTTATAVNFVNPAFDGGLIAAASFTVDSDTQITAVSPAVPVDGTVDVTVTNDVDTSILSSSEGSSADEYAFYQPGSDPVVTAVVPATGPASGGTHVTITGSGFGGSQPGDGVLVTAVQFGGVDAETGQEVMYSDTEITGYVSPPGSGVVDVTVTTPIGTSATSADDEFTYD